MQGLRKWLRDTPVTSGLIIVNVVVFIWMLIAFGLTGTSMSSTFSAQALFTAGARYTPAILAGQWWRLIAPMFIHLSFFHLGMNMVVLYFLGNQIEALFGHLRTLLIYLVSGVTGNIWSAVFLPKQLSAGASTAIFGLFGAFIMLGLVYRTNPYVRQMARQFIILVVLNLVLDVFAAGIDLWGHVGGLLGGFAIALLLGMPKQWGPFAWYWRALGGLCLLGTASLGWLIY